MSDERDPVVRDALGAIPVPPASDDFWATFEGRLAEAAAPVRSVDDDGPIRLVATAASGPDEARDLTVVPLAGRARSASTGAGRRRRYAVAAVAAAVAVAVAVAWRPSDEPTTEVASEPEAGAELSLPAGSGPADSTFAKVDAASPEGAVTLWLNALAAGDLAGAEALTGPATIAYELATTGRSPAEFLASYEERSFNRLEGDGAGSLRAIALGEFRGQPAQVVVLTQPLEGMDLPAASYPVVQTADGSWLVEPAAFSPDTGGRLEIVAPGPGEYGLEAIAAGAPIEVVAEGSGTYIVAVDDRAPVRIPAADAVDGRVRADVTDDLAAGDHLLIVARVDDDVFTVGAFHLPVQ